MRTALAAALFLASAHLFAQAGYGRGDALYEPGYMPIPTTPDQVVRRGVDRLTGFLMGAQNPSSEAIRGFLNREIAPSFDFTYMARWAAGPMYRRLSPAQHARMTVLLKDLFLSALAKNLGTYARPLPRFFASAERNRFFSTTVMRACCAALKRRYMGPAAQRAI